MTRDYHAVVQVTGTVEAATGETGNGEPCFVFPRVEFAFVFEEHEVVTYNYCLD